MAAITAGETMFSEAISSKLRRWRASSSPMALASSGSVFPTKPMVSIISANIVLPSYFPSRKPGPRPHYQSVYPDFPKSTRRRWRHALDRAGCRGPLAAANCSPLGAARPKQNGQTADGPRPNSPAVFSAQKGMCGRKVRGQRQNRRASTGGRGELSGFPAVSRRLSSRHPVQADRRTAGATARRTAPPRPADRAPPSHQLYTRRAISPDDRGRGALLRGGYLPTSI